MGTAPEQALGTEQFQKKQALSRIFTAVYGALKKQIVTAVQPVFLSPLVDQLKDFGQVTTHQILQHLFKSYGAIDKIDLQENAVKMMETYDPAEPLSHIIKQLKKGR